MSFEPDIIVTSRETPDIGLVVEAKLQVADPAVAEQQLKRYMFGMRCPVGLLVTRDTLRMYHDAYREHGIGSIDLVGHFAMPDALSAGLAPRGGSPRNARGARFEEAVQEWLEQLSRGKTLADLPADLRSALELHVLPVLAQGEIRAGGPRWRHTGS